LPRTGPEHARHGLMDPRPDRRISLSAVCSARSGAASSGEMDQGAGQGCVALRRSQRFSLRVPPPDVSFGDHPICPIYACRVVLTERASNTVAKGPVTHRPPSAEKTTGHGRQKERRRAQREARRWMWIPPRPIERVRTMRSESGFCLMGGRASSSVSFIRSHIYILLQCSAGDCSVTKKCCLCCY
jgi:hypothetical protein